MARKKTADSGNLDAFLEHAEESAQALRALSGRSTGKRQRGSSRGRGRSPGRPSRAELGAASADAAPFAEMATVPAVALYKLIRGIDDVTLLKRSHRYEAAHLRRQTVLNWIENRLRQLGAPIGGPASPPLRGYSRMSTQAVLELLQSANKQLAAHIYAWEFYHERRSHVLRAASALCGGAGDALVEATAPFRGIEQRPEPFAGFDRLSTSPHLRPHLRAALRSQSTKKLQDAREYELVTRKRTTMLDAIDVLLRSRA